MHAPAGRLHPAAGGAREEGGLGAALGGFDVGELDDLLVDAGGVDGSTFLMCGPSGRV